MPNIHSIDATTRACSSGSLRKEVNEPLEQALGAAPRPGAIAPAKQVETTFTNSSKETLIMNTKAVLFATLIAAASNAAFASDYTATAGNPEVQIAQSSSRAVVARSNVATGSANNVLRSDESYGTPVGKADGRTRAEVRAQTAAYNASGEARAARQLYVGGAQ